MRFKITLNIDKNTFDNRLPFNYQYELSAVIYKILAHADHAFAEWLHDNGFAADKKIFKLFSFSRLQIPLYRTEGSFMKILSDTATWYLSFLPERSTQEFIQGIFKEQQFELGNRQARIRCRVQSIELMPSPAFSEPMSFRTLSPMCLTLKRENGTDEYVAPTHPMARELILQNLLDKYKAFTGNDFPNHDAAFDFKVTNQPRSSLVTIKADTPQESKIRAFGCNFQLAAPVELLKIAYDGGIGSKNSLGFGMVEERKI
ncbi:MAG: CRISPR-associated endoribonuclease Cas6 [Paludibacteraceae bacterium]|nr:CRISPR-associated endoribonuclease Cas6 [Paludibacteraceae bacterium]